MWIGEGHARSPEKIAYGGSQAMPNGAMALTAGTRPGMK
jgi:hypothetical protein